MATIYCMGCGIPLEEGTLSCPECGAPTRLGMGMAESAHEVVPPDVAEASTALPRWEAIRQKLQASRTLTLGAVAAVVLLALVAATALSSGVFGAKSQEEAVPSEAEGTLTGEEALGAAGIAPKASLAEYSWLELSIIGKEMTRCASRDDALALAREYHLVDEANHMLATTKDVTIEGVGVVQVRLADVYHDTLADGSGMAGLTFLGSNVPISHAMKLSDDNIGGWEGSQLRSWLNSDAFSLLDDELASAIVAIDKHTNNVGNTTNVADVTSTLDKLWIPSVVEVCGPISWYWESDPANSDAYNAVMNAEGSQYACFAEAGIDSVSPNESLVRRNGEYPVSWWLRSSSASKPQHYRYVSDAGDPSVWAAATDELGVCWGFCL